MKKRCGVCLLSATAIISSMSLVEQIQKDITTAMKARDEHRLSTLRMVKSALKNREVDKMSPLDEKESQAVLATLIKQRKDSVAWWFDQPAPAFMAALARPDNEWVVPSDAESSRLITDIVRGSNAMARALKQRRPTARPARL